MADPKIVIELVDGYSNDLLAYLDEWVTNFTYRGHGYFNSATQPYNQWGAGDPYADAAAADGATASGVLLNGNQFTYTQGNFNGNIQELVFGTGIYNSGTDAYALDTEKLIVDLSGADLTTAFTYSIYILSNYGSFADQVVYGTSRPGLFSYFAEQGTEQIGTESDDVFFGFGGTDWFNFVLSDISATATVVGDDKISNFDVSADVIFIGLDDAAYDTYAELSIADNGAGYAVVDLGGYGSITLTGVSAASLTADNFEFV